MNELDILIVLIITLPVCYFYWRAGIFICIAAGFLQDTLRKLVPNEPVYYSVMIVVFVAATLLGAYRSGIRFTFAPIHSWNKVLRLPLNLFIGLVVIQSLLAYVKTNSLIIAGIGLMAYLTPLPAILLGYQFGNNEKNIINFARVYLIISLMMISGVYLSYLGYEWDALRSVGVGLYAYSPSGDFLTLHSGFLRSPEIAAWHACTAICFAILLVLIKQRWGIVYWLSGILIVFFGVAILLTGRRKFLMEIFIFVSVYVVLLIWFRKNALQSAFALIFALVLSFLVFTYALPDDFNSGISSYYQRGATVNKDAADRASLMSIESFQYVIAENGFLGSGAGTGSQGAQHFGGGANLVGGSAEGGLGKVLAELGVPGLVLLLWLFVSLARYIGSILINVKSDASVRSTLAFWLLSFQAANASVYIIAHQVFGDIFVLVILGFSLGFVLAIPQMQKAPIGAAIRREIRHPQDEVIKKPLPI
ncbi:MAG: hypothetical protein ACKVZH_23340 [Blastocatellia bacterium]